MPSLHIHGLAKKYGERVLLEGLNLEVEEGEIAVVMGPSGSGKTTLLLCILGFVQPDAGIITLDGINLRSLGVEQRQLAYVPQEYGLFPHLTVQENIAFGLRVRGISPSESVRIAQGMIKTVRLPPSIASRSVLNLSGGEKQRVALARALAIQPRLFLLDEPLSAVDYEMRREVGKELAGIIKKLKIPAIVVSHDPRDAQTIADTIYRLEEGRLRKFAFSDRPK